MNQQGVVSSSQDKYDSPNPSNRTDSPLLIKDDEERMSGEGDSFRRREPWLLRILCVFLATSCVVLLYCQLVSENNLESKCLKLHSVPSPGIYEISKGYKMIKFNGTLDHPSPYRGYPNPDIDKAWDDLTEVGLMAVSQTDIIEANLSPDSVRLPEAYGYKYMASVEMPHQLHCLNFLRKASYIEYYRNKAVEFSDNINTTRKHLDHCVEMLRQVLMCNADVGIISHHWVKDYPRPYPNFNTYHMCRDFDSVMGWIKGQDHVPQQPFEGGKWPVLPGSKIWDMAP